MNKNGTGIYGTSQNDTQIKQNIAEWTWKCQNLVFLIVTKGNNTCNSLKESHDTTKADWNNQKLVALTKTPNFGIFRFILLYSALLGVIPARSGIFRYHFCSFRFIPVSFRLIMAYNYIDYFMVGEHVRFLFTSCEESQTNEWAQRTSEFAIRHNKWIFIVQANQPWSNLFIIFVLRYYKCL